MAYKPKTLVIQNNYAYMHIAYYIHKIFALDWGCVGGGGAEGDGAERMISIRRYNNLVLRMYVCRC